ncbi:hypothetical protein SAMN05518684_107103 [Salipaludibacillus aurantiacus]|uniref:Uncharacterized protein n=1 Tax=Salipaludibacillus aurantiacus TaxID=1601833 RepID=A0A1H9UBQ5_9BACI|nr:hypothetical protein SAMN05518684_107103 [Salipaludibacillus aurantiacus]
MKNTLMRRAGAAAMGLAALVFLSGCGGDADTAVEGETEDIKELVHEYSSGNIQGEVASITSHELIVTDSEDNESVYDLPEEEFFVSIAPYVNETHP